MKQAFFINLKEIRNRQSYCQKFSINFLRYLKQKSMLTTSLTTKEIFFVIPYRYTKLSKQQKKFLLKLFFVQVQQSPLTCAGINILIKTFSYLFFFQQDNFYPTLQFSCINIKEVDKKLIADVFNKPLKKIFNHVCLKI